MCPGHEAEQEARKAQYTRWEDQPLGLELLVALGAAILAAELANRPTRLATPVLLAAGVLLGFIPAMCGIAPEVVVVRDLWNASCGTCLVERSGCGSPLDGGT